MALCVASPGPRKGDALSDFYKMDPADWDNGTARLTLEQEAAYLRIVNSIHKHKGPVPNVDRVLAGMFRTSTRRARALVLALQEAGKIVIDGDEIWNDRARSDLFHRGFTSISRSESGAKGGRMSGEARAKALKNNNPDEAIASYREEKRREEYTDANASAAEAAELTLRDQVWERGVRFLVARHVNERQARSVIGRWLKDHKDGEVFEAFVAASKESPVEPVAWITARLTKTKGTGNGKQADRLASILAGASPVDSGPGGNASQPLLASR